MWVRELHAGHRRGKFFFLLHIVRARQGVMGLQAGDNAVRRHKSQSSLDHFDITSLAVADRQNFITIC